MKQTCTFALTVALAVVSVFADTQQRERSSSRFGHIGYVEMERKQVATAEKGHGASILAVSRPAMRHEAIYNADGTLEIPFTLPPTQEDVERMTIIDVENDGRTWAYEETEEALFYRYSTKLDADDYAVIPIAVTEIGQLFRFSVSARCQNGYFGESFEMCAGSEATPEALQPIFASGMIYNEEYETFESYFAAPATGTYYVALHMVSPKNCMRFYVKDITVEKTEMSRLVPAMCSDVEATAAPAGELSATISFSAPALHADGTPLEASEPLTVNVVSAVETKSVTVIPGETAKVDIATVQGENTIELIPSNAEGEGLHATTTLFTGPDIPAQPSVTATVSADNMAVTLHMDVSSIGKNGGYVDPSTVEYALHTYVEEGYTGEWQLIKDLGAVDEYTYELPAGTAQAVVNLGVTASNAQGDNTSVVSVSEVLGTPYTLPATEAFAGRKFNYTPVVPEAPTDEYFAEYTTLDPTDLFEDAVNNSGIAMVGYITDYGATKGQLALPKFSTKDVASATIGLHVYFHDLMPPTTIELYGVEREPVTVGTFDATTFESGWHTVAFDIPADMLGRDWVCPTITSSFPGEDEEEYIIIDKYFLRPIVAHDIAVEAIYGDSELTVANMTEYVAVIENCGQSAANVENASFSVYANGAIIATQNVDAFTVAPGETSEATFSFTPTADHIGELTITLRIDDDDDDMTNNSATLDITVEKGEQQIITDLSGSINDVDGSIDLSWTAIGKQAGFSDMEKLSAFSYSKKLGEFTNYDGDGKTTFVVYGFSFPGNGYAKAFQVFNYPKSNIDSQAYLPFSGDQYLIAFAPDDEVTAADDYLISPAVSGDTELSFMFNIITGQYGAESIEIMTSSTDDSPESFTAIRTITKSAQGWEKITEQLPADAKYFALHYISCNTFGIMVDDIDYMPEEGLPSVTYNVYRNGVVIADNLTEPVYNDSEALDGTNRYNVTVVIDGEEQPQSNTAVIALSGVSESAVDANVSITGGAGTITISGLSGEPTSIFATDGRVVCTFDGQTGTVTLHVQPGIYIVRCGTYACKLHVAD